MSTIGRAGFGPSAPRQPRGVSATACCALVAAGQSGGFPRETVDLRAVLKVMVFGRRKESFFLNLEDSSQDSNVQLSPPQDTSTKGAAPEPETTPLDTTASLKLQPKAAKAATKAKSKAPTKAAAAVKTESVSTPPVASQSATATAVQTTAEAIAADLAAAEAARPVAPLTTFAPDNLLPGSGLIQKRRRPGASLNSFRSIAGDLFKN